MSASAPDSDIVARMVLSVASFDANNDDWMIMRTSSLLITPDIDGRLIIESGAMVVAS